jgi:hypothetical protein
MRIVLSGGEKGSYRNLLVANGVRRIALNVTQLTVPKKKEFDFDQFKGADLYVYTTDDDSPEKYDEFLRHYHPSLTMAIGRPDYDGSWMGDKYVPVWNDPDDLERLAYLCEKYGRVAVADKAITARSIPRIRQLQQRWKSSLVALTSKVDTIEALEWDVVVVTSWTSVVRYGETQVWDGHALRRFPAAQKDSARKRLRSAISRLGVDVEAIMEDDVNEVAKLAIRSWLEYEMQTYGSTTAAYDPWEGDEDENEFDDGATQVATTTPETAQPPKPSSKGSAIAISSPETRHEDDRVLLPVIGMETVVSNITEIDPNTGDTVETQGDPTTVIRKSSASMRACDSCYLATKCPRFQEHAECAYQIPVELKTKDQLRAVLTALLEIQTDRVLFAKFAEDLEGQGMDPALSSEMDRLFRLVKDLKEITDTRDVFSVNIEAKSSSGVLERIFGAKSAPQKQLANPMSRGELDEAMSSVMPIVDGEVID